MGMNCFTPVKLGDYKVNVSNDASKTCNFNSQNYDSCLSEVKVYTNAILKDLTKINNAVKIVSSDPKTGKTVKNYCDKVSKDVTKMSSLLKNNRDQLCKQLDSEFRRQLCIWIEWCKKQQNANSTNE